MGRARSIANGDPLLLWIGGGLLASAVLLAHASSFLPFLSDDALISLRYASRLLDGNGLSWTDGPPVEGYSNLLWVLACAALGALGFDLIDAARVLGAFGSSAALFAVARAACLGGYRGALPLAAGTLGVALSASVAIWTVGGLEQPAVAGCLGWALVATFSLLREEGASPASAFRVGLLYAPLCWLRPDGVLFAAAASAGLAVACGFRGEVLASGARLLAAPVAAVAVQVAFRLAYYGELLPNTAHAKMSISAVHLSQGIAYVASGIGMHLPWVGCSAVLGFAALRDPVSGPRVRLLGVLLVIWCGYVAVIGGDIFPGYRHLVPAVVVLALIAVEGAAVAAAGPAASIVAGVTIVALLGLYPLQRFDASVGRARTERWEWDGEVVGRLLGRAFADEQPLLAVDPAGTLPYFSGLPAIDMLGLNDRYLAKHPPDDFGSGWIGHELGNGAYVLDREPDLILFCTPAGGIRPCFRSGAELVADPRFRKGYRLMRIEGSDPYVYRSELFVRLEGGRIGVERESGRVRIPAHLLMANPATVATPGEDGRLGIVVRPDRPAAVDDIALRAGTWRFAADASRPVRVAVRSSGGGRAMSMGELASFTLHERTRVRVEVEVGSGEPAAFVHAVVLERVASPPSTDQGRGSEPTPGSATGVPGEIQGQAATGIWGSSPQRFFHLKLSRLTGSEGLSPADS